uniref:Putative ovule protein n=1 Tax=Solanum chacoense TaxID=4108 RepID=A0A0V0GS31_SOLCH
MLYSSTLRICWRSSKRSQKKKSRRMLLTEILTNLLVLIHLFLSFYTNNKRYNTIPFNFMDGIGPIFEVSAISLFPYIPPYTVRDDFPPSLLALASSSSNPTTQHICRLLRHGS